MPPKKKDGSICISRGSVWRSPLLSDGSSDFSLRIAVAKHGVRCVRTGTRFHFSRSEICFFHLSRAFHHFWKVLSRQRVRQPRDLAPFVRGRTLSHSLERRVTVNGSVSSSLVCFIGFNFCVSVFVIVVAVCVKGRNDSHFWHSTRAFQALCFLCLQEVSNSGLLTVSHGLSTSSCSSSNLDNTH